MPMQGPVVTSTTSHVPPATPTMAQSTSVPSMAGPLPEDLNTSTTSVRSARIKELQKRRYEYKQKMSPRVGISAAYVPHSLHIFADVLLRDICSADWCASHPEGTVGEFNLYWVNMDEDLRKVRLTQSSCTSNTHISHIFLGVQRKRGGKKGRNKGKYNKLISSSAF